MKTQIQNEMGEWVELDIDTLPDSRSLARLIGTRHYYTGTPCKRGHIAKRDTRNRTCMECARTRLGMGSIQKALAKRIEAHGSITISALYDDLLRHFPQLRFYNVTRALYKLQERGLIEIDGSNVTELAK